MSPPSDDPIIPTTTSIMKETLDIESGLERLAMLRKKGSLTVEEAAYYMGISRQTLYNRLSANQGPRRTKPFNRWLFDIKDLDAYMKSGTKVFGAFT